MCLSSPDYCQRAIAFYQSRVLRATPEMLSPVAEPSPFDPPVVVRYAERVAMPRPPRPPRFPLSAAIDLCVIDLKEGGAAALANRLRRLPAVYILPALSGVIARCAEETEFAQRLRRQLDQAEVCLDDWLDYVRQQQAEAACSMGVADHV